MIILTMPGEINSQCGKLLGQQFSSEKNQFNYPLDPFLSWRGIHEKTMLVIDIGEKNYCLEKLNPDYWAGELIKRQLPTDLSDLYLISSSLILEKNLVEFANQLAKIFKEKYERNINVHIPACAGYDFTVVIPPLQQSEWQVVGIQKKDVSDLKKISTTHLSEIKNKTVVWHGHDILQWLNDPQRIFNGNSFVRGNE